MNVQLYQKKKDFKATKNLFICNPFDDDKPSFGRMQRCSCKSKFSWAQYFGPIYRDNY